MPALLAPGDEVRGGIYVERVLPPVEADEDAERLELGVLLALVGDDAGERDRASRE